MKASRVIVFSFLSALLIFLPVFAKDSDLSPAQTGAITQYCDTMKQSFHNLQISDANVRSHLGRTYESIFSDFMKPLNKRLVDNAISAPDLITLQGDFSAARTKFNSDFITYSQSLEELIASDCKNSPDTFMKKLKDTREKRSIVASDVKSLKKIVSSFRTKVAALEVKK